MPRVCTGVIADSRTSISFAALLVNVTARIDSGDACPVPRSQAMRVVSTRVLPLPAPARISADWCGSVTAASCSGLRLARSGEVIGNPERRNLRLQAVRRGRRGASGPELYVRDRPRDGRAL